MKSRNIFLLVFCALTGCAAPTNRVSPPTPPLGEPGNIAGMDSSRIRIAFGVPQFVRKDGATEMWRYDGSNCRAFFFFYPNGNALAVRHVETLPRGTTQAADSNCLAGLLARAKGVS